MLLKKKDLTVLAQHYDSHADSYLVLGKRKNRTKSLKRYVVAWRSRHRDQFAVCHYFTDSHSAEQYFNDVVYDEDRPDHPLLQKDWQKKAVYDWEQKTLIPHSRKINEKQARVLLQKVSRECGMKSPRLVWDKPAEGSSYDIDDHVIHFGHRDNISLLHEMAHVLYKHDLDESETDIPTTHSPGFVWTAIELYHRYAGINLNYLIIMAAQQNILGDMSEHQIIFAERPLQQNVKNNGPKKPKPP